MITGIGEYLIKHKVPLDTIFLIACLLLLAVIVLIYLSNRLDKRSHNSYPKKEIPPHIKKIFDDIDKKSKQKGNIAKP